MAKYPEYRQSRRSFGLNVLGTLVIELEASDGTTGFAVTTGGEIGAWIAEHHLARFVEGQKVTDVRRSGIRCISPRSITAARASINTLSGIDLALWDLLGRIRKEPVYHLLAGRCGTN
jgi:L-rhamnonate dehydratase